MASIWMITAKDKKVEGMLHPAKVVRKFHKRVAAMAAANPKAKVTYQDDVFALFRFPDGSRFALQVEPYSPPSAPEPGQPKRQGMKPGDGGVVIDRAGKVHMLKDPEPPQPENAL